MNHSGTSPHSSLSRFNRVFSALCAFALIHGSVSRSFGADASSPSPDQSLERLIEGNRRFVGATVTHPDQTVERRTSLAGGQAPFAIVLACADSRVAPEIVFDQGLGDIFVVRVAGNIVDPAILGSIEYAAEHLHAPLVVVLGHEKCGAVKATLDGGHPAGHIHDLVAAIEPAIAASRSEPGDPLDNAVRANVRSVVATLRASTPVLSELVSHGKLRVVGARYDLDTGAVEFLP